MEGTFDFPRSSSLTNGSVATMTLLNDFHYASDWKTASSTQGNSYDWRTNFGQNGYNGFHRKNYKARSKEIDLSPLLEVLKRIDEIDTSMEGKRKARINVEVPDSGNGSSLLDSAIVPPVLINYDKDSSFDNSDDKQGNSDRHRNINPRYGNTSPRLGKHLTVPDVKSDFDTSDDISNFTDEEYIHESLTPEDPESKDNGTLDDSIDSNHTVDNNDDEHTDSFGYVYRENRKHVNSESSVELEVDKSGKSNDKSSKINKDKNEFISSKADEVENKFKKKRIPSAGFNMDHMNKPKNNRAGKEWASIDSNMDRSGYVTEDDFEQLCTDIDEPFSDDDNVDDDSDKTDTVSDDESSDSSIDSIEEELSWRSRGYNNDFFISRKSVVGSEIISCFNKARSRHSSKHSSRSSGSCTPKRSGSDSDRATPLAKPSKLFHTSNSAPITRNTSKSSLVDLKHSSSAPVMKKTSNTSFADIKQANRKTDCTSAPITRNTSNSSFTDLKQAEVIRKSEPIIRVGSAGRLREIADRYRTKSIDEEPEGADRRTEGQNGRRNSRGGILKGGGGGVRVAELKAALEREIEKAKTK